MSKFLVAVIGDEDWVTTATPEEMEKLSADMNAYNEQLEKAGVMVDGQGLGPSANAKTLRYGEDGKAVVTDGPFSESKEQLGGFWVFEVKDIDDAVEWARKAPMAGGTLAIHCRYSGRTAMCSSRQPKATQICCIQSARRSARSPARK